MDKIRERRWIWIVIIIFVSLALIATSVLPFLPPPQ